MEEYYGGYITGYKCEECNWVAGGYDKQGPYGLPLPTLCFHNCCPECGYLHVRQITGRYLYRKTKKFFFLTKTERIKFVPRGE